MDDFEFELPNLTPEQMRRLRLGWTIEPRTLNDWNIVLIRCGSGYTDTKKSLEEARDMKMPLWFRQRVAKSNYRYASRLGRIRRGREQLKAKVYRALAEEILGQEGV